MIKKTLLYSVIILLLGACSEKEENKNEPITKKVEIQAPLKIEIEENKNIQEIKVAEKENKRNENETYYFNYNGVKSEYDPNSKPANEDAAVRVKPRTQIDANMHIRSPYENVKISMLVKRLSKEFIIKCSACHNDYANGVIGPSLLNKSSDFIFEKIIKFKNDKNTNILMTELVNQMDEAQIRALANEIYEFNEEINKLGK